jgi:5-methyltetrahydrofolate--homocysteine methyltransferase
VDGLEVLDKIRGLVVGSFDTERVKKEVREALNSDVDPQRILDSLNEALEEVGVRYEGGEYFLSELMMAGMIVAEVTNMFEPYFAKAGKGSQGKVVIGTVKGDMHDIGKNVVIMMLRAAGFDIVDLGVDVPAERFADKIGKEDANILGLSALLTSTMNEMNNVIATIKEMGLRDQVRIVVGGRPVTREFAEEIGADGYAKDAVKAVKVFKDLAGALEG